MTAVVNLSRLLLTKKAKAESRGQLWGRGSPWYLPTALQPLYQLKHQVAPSTPSAYIVARVVSMFDIVAAVKAAAAKAVKRKRNS